MENNLPSSSSSGSPLRWIAFIVIVLVLGGAGFTAVRNGPNPDNQNQNQNQNPSPSATVGTPLSPHTLVYGSWVGNGSEITAVDLSTRKFSTLAKLPVAIKKVSVMSPNTLLYIDGTDRRDHGKRLVLYDVKTKNEITNIPAANGFGIDDYVVSPNKKYVAIWEVSFAEGSQVLHGGRSRVYAVDISNPSVKMPMYDETATGPIRYPRAILDNGKVFTDRFLPNDPHGAGWAYGMSVSNFDGSGKQDLAQMEEGSYGTQPSLSTDGKYLVFSGYDGTKGDGKAINNGFRQALITPNTVETLDTNSLIRKNLPNLSNDDSYISADWDRATGKIIFSAISSNPDNTGVFLSNTTGANKTKVNMPESTVTIPYAFLSGLTGEKFLIAGTDSSQSSLGNLGETYAASAKQFYLFEPQTGSSLALQATNSLMQYISIHPANYFQYVLGAKAYAQGGNPSQPNVTIIDLYSDKPAEENLQLKTFMMKTELAPVREEQQTEQPTLTPTQEPTQPPEATPRPTKVPKPTNPPIVLTGGRCRDLAERQCNMQGLFEGQPGYSQCFATNFSNGKRNDTCYDSPLYIYGRSGDKVSVKVQTPVYNDVPQYSDGYNITILSGGKMLIKGKIYSAINYDYRSNLRKLTPPTKGTIVPRSGVEKTLREYARGLGLNEKETADLVRVGKTKVTYPYVFISFFDHETSSSILPLSFIPKPDNYLNVVFYFKLLDKKPSYTPVPPTFGKPINRTGLTAVEVSEIVE